MENRPLPEINDTNRPYWEAAKRHELLLPKCGSCGKFFLPPRSWCPHCYAQDKLGWALASGRGIVASFSKLYLTPFEGYVEKFPYVLATVKLAEGPQMMANIINCDPEAVHVGSQLKVTFEERAEGVVVPQFELV